MKVIVTVKGISPDNSWRYRAFTYSCKEHIGEHKSIYSEGQWYTSRTPDSISTLFSFVIPLITPDTKERFLELLKSKLNSEFANQMPTTSDFEDIAFKIKACLCPTLKNCCFTYFSNNYSNGSAEKLSNIPNDIIQDFEDFRQSFRLNERW